ncbi:hypothetical protein IWW56_002194 [Coemansia sp. RSA 2131]|nr:hypothetical protein IWW56_002194 [Coemansia sp. RSA 2131]
MVALSGTLGSIRSRASSVDKRAAMASPPVRELSETARHTLAFRLVALAIMAYLARFLISLVKYALDAALLLLLATSAAAVVGPGAKNNMVTQLLVQVESFVDPVFAIIADRGLTVVSGPMKAAAHYLGLGTSPAQS